MRGLVTLTKSGWKTTLTGSCLALKSWQERSWQRMGSVASFQRSWVTMAGLFPGSPGVHGAFELDDGFFVEEFAAFGESSLGDGVEERVAHVLGDGAAGFVEFVEHGLIAEDVDVDVFGGGAGDDEGDDVDGDSAGAEPVVESCECFDEEVHALVAVFVATGDEEVEGFFEVEIVGGEEVAGDELVDDFLVVLVEVLEFVDGGEFLDVQAVGGDDVRAGVRGVFSASSPVMSETVVKTSAAWAAPRSME